MKTGKLIVFEGLNGCGKGTHLSKLTDFVYGLDKANTIFRTREPNIFDGNGQKARDLLKSVGDPYSNNVAAVGYFAENRKVHNEIFVPMLEKGIDVFSDRYWYSNFAFQGAQGISYEDIAMANKGSRVPDLTILIDVPVDVVFGRLEKRDGLSRRKFDSDKEFVNKVRDSYLEFSEVLPGLMGDESIVVVDGDQSVEAVFEEIKGAYLAS
jgi:dTMP kinase